MEFNWVVGWVEEIGLTDNSGLVDSQERQNGSERAAR